MYPVKTLVLGRYYCKVLKALKRNIKKSFRKDYKDGSCIEVEKSKNQLMLYYTANFKNSLLEQVIVDITIDKDQTGINVFQLWENTYYQKVEFLHIHSDLIFTMILKLVKIYKIKLKKLKR